MRTFHRAGPLLVLAGLLSCGDDGAGPQPRAQPAFLEPVGAVSLEPVVGTQAQIRVRVLDAERRGFAGAEVAFELEGSGALAAASVTTDAEGFASNTWSFGTVAGPQTVTASVAGIEPVTFTAAVAPGPPAAIAITPQVDTLMLQVLGDTTRLSATVVDSFGNVIPGLTVTWTTGDALVADVTATGLVTAVARGTTTIRATHRALVKRVTVRVVPEPVSVTLSPAEVLLDALGATATLEADVRDAGGTRITDASITWSSEDTAIATVSAAGVVTARAPGSVRVTAQAGAVADTALVTVHQRVVEVRVLPDSALVETGATRQFTAELIDPLGNPIERAVDWSTTQPALATVDETGLLTALAPGQLEVVASVDGVSDGAGVLVHDPILAVMVSSGGWHTCALATNLRAYCWGYGSSGRLGNGSTQTRTSPVPVSGEHIFKWIGAGYQHTCALRQDGVPYCWGGNSYGQLGIGAEVFSVNTPTVVNGGHTFVKMAVGDYHTCGLRADGTVWCWGLNLSGMSGVPEDHAVCGTISEDPCAPEPVQAAPGMTFIDIATYRVHTCGLTAGGDVYCWGSNLYGQLGDGTAGEDASGPAPRLVQGGGGFAALAGGGGFHSCALKADRTAWCWGLDHAFQLGNNLASSDQCSGERCSRAPMAVAGGLAFTHLETGYANTCGAVAGDNAYCWGSNQYYALGDGTTVDRPVPTPVINARYDYVTTGMLVHSVIRTTGCAIANDGRLWCWGTNLEGQVGIGTSGTDDVQTQPVRVRPFPYRAPPGAAESQVAGPVAPVGLGDERPTRAQIERVMRKPLF